MFPSPADGKISSSGSYDPLMYSPSAEEPPLDFDDEFVSGLRLSTSLLFSPTSGKSDTDSDSSTQTHVPPRNKFLFPKTEIVEALRPEEVRWFYKEANDKKNLKKWIPFIGYDSLRIECQYQELLNRSSGDKELEGSPISVDKINVRGGLYEVDVVTKKCVPVYWSKLPGTTTSIKILHGF